MSVEWKAILFGLAVAAFVCGVIGAQTRRRPLSRDLWIALGLALFAFPFFWDALVEAT